VSRRLYFFAREYLVRYRYTSGLVALPNEIILGVVQLLGSWEDCSRLPRTSRRHENVALILSQGLEANSKLSIMRDTVLAYACEAKLVKLVCYLLERDPRPPDWQTIDDCSAYLYRLLDDTVYEGEFVKRKLLEDVYEIAVMLLRHGARFNGGYKQYQLDAGITRYVAIVPRHPNPRGKNLLLKTRAIPPRRPEEYSLHIGLSTLNTWAIFVFEELRPRQFFFHSSYNATP
jgi:hypothetical protein